MSVTLETRFPEIEKEIAVRISAAVKTGAEIIAEAAKTKVNLGPDPYHLRDEIHVERQGIAEYAVVAGDRNTFYGHILEHGSVYAAPRPFLIPALEENYGEAAAEVKGALKVL